MNAEQVRLRQTARREVHWRRWGPYLSERAWGTVREDYSVDGDAWDFFPHDHARSRVYRWGEDGLCGICDNHQRLCFAIALWNGRDPILKERLFGLTGQEGNHGEDVKEYYYYLDSTPTHSYMKCLYKYPQAEYPYSLLVEENRRRTKRDPEFELIDTGIFNENRYFDVFVEYAKANAEDILMRITVVNRGPDRAPLHLLPTLWFRDTWSWDLNAARPKISLAGDQTIEAQESTLGAYSLWFGEKPREILFTENATNTLRFEGRPSPELFYKDAFHDRVVSGRPGAVNPRKEGTKACGWWTLDLAAGETKVFRLRLGHSEDVCKLIDFDSIFERRKAEADEFYQPENRNMVQCDLSSDARMVERQAMAGLLWSKQFYHLDMNRWLRGDPTLPKPHRQFQRNEKWTHLFNEDIISMPDKWEYPWYAAWDLAFHMIGFVYFDPEFAKSQLGLFLREWYMHPGGQIPAYEWAFSDVNPPVHAWACWRVYKIDQKMSGKGDYRFLEGAFHKLLMNFTWWTNRKDSLENNIFEGGFLGLDNIGVFDRNKPLGDGAVLEQSDATSWMAMFCLDMLQISLELAQTDPVYEDVASKFFEHFLFIANAMNNLGGTGLWDEDDGFYYDRLMRDGQGVSVKVRSLVGLIPLYAVYTLESETINRLPGFRKRMEWFIDNRPDLCVNIASLTREGVGERRLLALVPPKRLERILQRLFDETEFLSPYGIRSLSRVHKDRPYVLQMDGVEHRVDYEPGDSQSGMFGGNSNWRGPVWMPTNFLLVESLQRFAYYYGDSLQVEYPTGSGKKMRLDTAAAELSRRISHLFLRDAAGRRPVFGRDEKFQQDPQFKDYILFYEYFNGDNGAGVGASHQTGWTALVAKLLQQSGE